MNPTDDLPDTITLGDQDYDVSTMKEPALAQLRGIHFCDRQIQQLHNEWAIADTARLGYLRALKLETKTPRSEAENG